MLPPPLALACWLLGAIAGAWLAEVAYRWTAAQVARYLEDR